MLAATAAMMMRADRGLIHSCDHRRAEGRTDWRGRVRPPESQALLRKAINVRRLNRLLAVTRKVRRHVVDHNPEDVRALVRKRGGCRDRQGDYAVGKGEVRFDVLAKGLLLFYCVNLLYFIRNS